MNQKLKKFLVFWGLICINFNVAQEDVYLVS